METENRPNAALINREWYESAKGVLGDKDLSCVLVAAVEYVLYGDTDITLQGSAAVVFAMIKPALDSDITKYRERCPRNAANARGGGQRVAASGSESQRVVANTTTTTTPTTTPTTTTTPSISEEEQRGREKFEIYGYFWSVGSADPMGELDAFWNYYESLGWKNNKGAVILSKIAAARMWRRQYETRTPPNGAAQWYRAVQECSVPDTNSFHCFAGVERVEGLVTVNLRCSARYLERLKEVTPKLEGDLRAFWRGCEVIFKPAG